MPSFLLVKMLGLDRHFRWSLGVLAKRMKITIYISVSSLIYCNSVLQSIVFDRPNVIDWTYSSIRPWQIRIYKSKRSVSVFYGVFFLNYKRSRKCVVYFHICLKFSCRIVHVDYTPIHPESWIRYVDSQLCPKLNGFSSDNGWIYRARRVGHGNGKIDVRAVGILNLKTLLIISNHYTDENLM